MASDIGCMYCRHWERMPDSMGGGYNVGLCDHPNLVGHLDPTTGWRNKNGHLPTISSEACREVLSLCAGEAKWFEPLVQENGNEIDCKEG